MTTNDKLARAKAMDLMRLSSLLGKSKPVTVFDDAGYSISLCFGRSVKSYARMREALNMLAALNTDRSA